MMMLFFILFTTQLCNAQVPKECVNKQMANVTFDKGPVDRVIKHIDRLKALHDHKVQDRHLNNFHLFMKPVSRYFTNEGNLYIISDEPVADVTKAFGLCGVYGGYLVQIDDHQELGQIKNNIVNLPEIKCILIGISDPLMTDEWIYPMTRLSAFTAFGNVPPTNRVRQCASLERTMNFKMNKAACIITCHFMCEIPGGADE